jgi:hypothetical protein
MIYGVDWTKEADAVFAHAVVQEPFGGVPTVFNHLVDPTLSGKFREPTRSGANSGIV